MLCQMVTLVGDSVGPWVYRQATADAAEHVREGPVE